MYVALSTTTVVEATRAGIQYYGPIAAFTPAVAHLKV